MGWLGKLGHAAFDALDTAARLAAEARRRKNASSAPEPESPAPDEVPVAASTPAPDATIPKKRRTGLGKPEVAVQVFGRMTCSFTHRARRLLDDRGIEYEFTELDAPEGFALAPKLQSSTGQRTVPYVYVRGRFVGGFDGLDEIDRLGMLDDMSKSAEERSAGGGSRIRIVAPPPRHDSNE